MMPMVRSCTPPRKRMITTVEAQPRISKPTVSFSMTKATARTKLVTETMSPN